MRSRNLMLMAACAAMLGGCESSTDVEATYTASLSGAAERPDPVQSNGTGTFNATLDEDNVLTYSMQFSGLTTNTVAAHIHGPASTDVAADVLVNFDATAEDRTIVLGGTSGSASGTIDLDLAISPSMTGAQFRTHLDAGELYVNVHTQTNPGGEVRGQIVRQ